MFMNMIKIYTILWISDNNFAFFNYKIGQSLYYFIEIYQNLNFTNFTNLRKLNKVPAI